MKKSKRFLLVLMSIVLTFSSFAGATMFPTEVEAEDNNTFSGSFTADPSDVVVVSVNIAENPGILGATITLEYDSGLTLKTAENGTAFSALSLTKPGALTSPCSFLWDAIELDSSDIKTGTILKLTFEVDSTAESDAEYNYSVSYDEGDVVDTNTQTVYPTFSFDVNAGTTSEESANSKSFSSKFTADPEDTATVSVNIAENPGIIGATLKLEYDSGLTLVSVENGEAFSALELTQPGVLTSGCKFLWDCVNLESSDIKTGTILELTFEVDSTAESNTEYNFKISYNIGDIVDIDLNTVNPSLTLETSKQTSEITEPTIKVDTVTAKPGTEVNVDISLINNPGIAYAQLKIQYDSNLTYNSVSYNEDFDCTPTFKKKTSLLTWDNDGEDFIGDTVLATFTFTVADDAPEGSYPISITYDADSLYNSNEDNVTFDVIDGAVNVSNSVIDSVAVSVGSSLKIKTYADVDADIDLPKVRFTRGKDVVISDGYKEEGSDLWTFNSNLIYANNMSDTVKIELMDGDTVIDKRNYSVRDYCDGLYGSSADELGLSDTQFEKLKTFIADMLEFGAMTQIYSDYKTSDLANNLSWVDSTKTAEFSAPASDKETTVGTEDATKNKIRTCYVRINECIELMFVVKSTDGTTLEISNETDTREISLSTQSQVDNVYTISAGKLKACQLGDVFTVSLKNGDTILHEVKYSAYSYVASYYSSSDEKLANLCKAIYKYGVSANAYADAIAQ